MTVTAAASPSLALIKYWGKLAHGTNLPATSSLAVTLDGLRTTTRVTEADASPAGVEADEIIVGNRRQALEPYRLVLEHFRTLSGRSARVRVESENSFPTAAGIASSSSGFAALVTALDAYHETGLDPRQLSAAARLGSGSAARAVYGGFTGWRAGAEHAEQLFPAEHWPDLRVLVVVLNTGTKPLSSRAGMTRARDTSPVYAAWCEESTVLFDRGLRALRDRDLESLGEAMRESYLLMFSTMFTSRPAFIYWHPESVAVIHAAEAMRRAGLPVWETMDAGPQVKLVTLERHAAEVEHRIRDAAPNARILTARPGGAPEVSRE
jgi:diphosphomevalonate decarboxylase